MNYTKEREFSIRLSASWLNNNLAVIRDDSVTKFAVAHKYLLSIASFQANQNDPYYKELSCRDAQRSAQILQVKFLLLGGRLLLAVGSEKGLQIYDGDGAALLFWFALGKKADNVDERYVRGLCGFGKYLYCASSDGQIACFEIPTVGAEILMKVKVNVCRGCIWDLSAGSNMLCSSDDEGNITVWDIDTGNGMLKSRQKIAVGCVALSVCIWRSCVVAGCSNGQLKVWDATSGALLCAAHAHARLVGAISVAEDAGLVASVSDDSHVRVWRLTEAGGGAKVELVWQECVKDAQLVGCQFLTPDGATLAVAASESELVRLYKLAAAAAH